MAKFLVNETAFIQRPQSSDAARDTTGGYRGYDIATPIWQVAPRPYDVHSHRLHVAVIEL